MIRGVWRGIRFAATAVALLVPSIVVAARPSISRPSQPPRPGQEAGLELGARYRMSHFDTGLFEHVTRHEVQPQARWFLKSGTYAAAAWPVVFVDGESPSRFRDNTSSRFGLGDLRLVIGQELVGLTSPEHQTNWALSVEVGLRAPTGHSRTPEVLDASGFRPNGDFELIRTHLAPSSGSWTALGAIRAALNIDPRLQLDAALALEVPLTYVNDIDRWGTDIDIQLGVRWAAVEKFLWLRGALSYLKHTNDQVRMNQESFGPNTQVRPAGGGDVSSFGERSTVTLRFGGAIQASKKTRCSLLAQVPIKKPRQIQYREAASLFAGCDWTIGL